MLIRAHATLVTGCDFVAQRRFQPGIACSWTRGVHNRMTANHLRELDRFLCVLLEEGAALLGGADHDAPAFARLRKTSEKLFIVQQMVGTPTDHASRLAAIRRIAARLRRSSPASQAKDISLACEAPLDLPLAVQSIALFYRDLGNELMKKILVQRQILDFSEP
ncbi:MAG TPA: hypothetical protein VFF84_12285 [Sphingobium sp.]|nr:hypothetical protein [Sphingobium sp.]